MVGRCCCEHRSRHFASKLAAVQLDLLGVRHAVENLKAMGECSNSLQLTFFHSFLFHGLLPFGCVCEEEVLRLLSK